MRSLTNERSRNTRTPAINNQSVDTTNRKLAGEFDRSLSHQNRGNQVAKPHTSTKQTSVLKQLFSG